MQLKKSNTLSILLIDVKKKNSQVGVIPEKRINFDIFPPANILIFSDLPKD